MEVCGIPQFRVSTATYDFTDVNRRCVFRKHYRYKLGRCVLINCIGRTNIASVYSPACISPPSLPAGLPAQTLPPHYRLQIPAAPPVVCGPGTKYTKDGSKRGNGVQQTTFKATYGSRNWHFTFDVKMLNACTGNLKADMDAFRVLESLEYRVVRGRQSPKKLSNVAIDIPTAVRTCLVFFSVLSYTPPT